MATVKTPVARQIRNLLCLLTAAATYVCGQGTEPTEYQVEAAFLLNFTRFVEWPSSAFADSDSPLAICILGTDPFGGMLDQLILGEAANGRKLVARRMARPPQPQVCQVLYISPSVKDVRSVLPDLAPGILTVGRGEKFTQDGGIIAFVVDNRHVRFDINQRAASKASLNLSARLLTVARAVLK